MYLYDSNRIQVMRHIYKYIHIYIQYIHISYIYTYTYVYEYVYFFYVCVYIYKYKYTCIICKSTHHLWMCRQVGVGVGMGGDGWRRVLVSIRDVNWERKRERETPSIQSMNHPLSTLVGTHQIRITQRKVNLPVKLCFLFTAAWRSNWDRRQGRPHYGKAWATRRHRKWIDRKACNMEHQWLVHMSLPRYI